jgi:hypothetical protein
MKLLNSQKDQIFDLIEEQNLSPSQFEFNEEQGNIVSPTETTILTFKKTKYFFQFDLRNGGHYSIFSPGKSTVIEEDFPRDWKNQLINFKKWILYLSKEINTPNKWDRLRKEINEINIGFSAEEEKFSFQEYEELSNKIKFLKENIREVGLSNDQILGINRKLDFLLESAKTLSKFDWKSLFVGTIINLIIQLGLTPEISKSLWNLIEHIFNQLFLN